MTMHMNNRRRKPRRNNLSTPERRVRRLRRRFGLDGALAHRVAELAFGPLTDGGDQ